MHVPYNEVTATRLGMMVLIPLLLRNEIDQPLASHGGDQVVQNEEFHLRQCQTTDYVPVYCGSDGSCPCTVTAAHLALGIAGLGSDVGKKSDVVHRKERRVDPGLVRVHVQPDGCELEYEECSEYCSSIN